MKNLGLALALGLIISTVALSQDSTGIITSELVKSGSSWDGSPLPAYPTGKPEITILRITIPPGAALPQHQHPVINAGAVLRGELTVVTEDGKTLHLKAGDGLVEVVKKWHYGRNTGKTPTEILVFYAGAENTPITVRK